VGDARLVWDPLTQTADLVMSGPSIEIGNDLETAVLISLFTDHVAEDGDILLPSDAADPRGWWADSYEQDEIGSKLWQVFARQTVPDTLNWVQDTCSKALQWMIDDGVAASVSAIASLVARGAVGVQIVITEPTGKKNSFSYVWTQEA
jgi:phage gp46-like protein